MFVLSWRAGGFLFSGGNIVNRASVILLIARAFAYTGVRLSRLWSV